MVMVYAGGLHYNRWKVLAEVANALKEINASGKAQCFLKIYSSQKISPEITKQLTVENAAAFMGGASASAIADIYAAADVLLHVESFDKKAIAATKYSFSTKIPEYLSAGKCVLAVGPAEVASIQYLTEFACAVTDEQTLPEALMTIIGDDAYRRTVEMNCEKQYEKDFSKKKQEEFLNHILSGS